MMDIEKLIETLRQRGVAYVRAYGRYCSICDEVVTALSTLQAENAQLRGELEYEQEHANAYHEECGQWEAENEKLRAELEQVKRERAAAVEDVAAIIGDVEEIRRGYGVDNADADGAFAELCETYCANKGRPCYAECEKYHCKNFKWRGQKED